MTDTPLPESFTEAQQLMLDQFKTLLSKDTLTNADIQRLMTLFIQAWQFGKRRLET